MTMQTDPSLLTTLFCFGSLLVVAFGIGVVALILATRSKRPKPQERTQSAPQRQQPTGIGGQSYAPIHTLLTEAEQSFFVALRSAVPQELLICPQVRLANLVRPTARNARQNKYDFYRIQAKCVDFVLCEPGTTKPRLVIELDDSSHQRADRRKRDDFVDAVLTQVNLPILHVPWQRSYNVSQLADAITGKLPGYVSLPAPTQTPQVPQAGGWATPIKLDPAPASVQAEPAMLTREVTYLCGQCQRQVRREATFCNHCGTVL